MNGEIGPENSPGRKRHTGVQMTWAPPTATATAELIAFRRRPGVNGREKRVPRAR